MEECVQNAYKFVRWKPRGKLYGKHEAIQIKIRVMIYMTQSILYNNMSVWKTRTIAHSRVYTDTY